MFDENFGLSTSQILQKLSSQVGGSYDGGEVKVTTEGREYFFFIYLPVRGGGQGNLIGRPSFFEFKTKIPYPHPEFSIKKSDSIDFVTEHIIGVRDYQVGDPEFDSKFIIKLHNNDWGIRFFSDAKSKQYISDLLLQDFDAILSEDDYLKIIKYLPIGTSYPTAELVTNAIEKTENIISAIPDNYNNNDALEILFRRSEEAKKTRTGCLWMLFLMIIFPVLFWILTRSLGLYIAKLWQ